MGLPLATLGGSQRQGGGPRAIGDLAEAERQHVRAVGLLEGIDLPPHRPTR